MSVPDDPPVGTVPSSAGSAPWLRPLAVVVAFLGVVVAAAGVAAGILLAVSLNSGCPAPSDFGDGILYCSPEPAAPIIALGVGIAVLGLAVGLLMTLGGGAALVLLDLRHRVLGPPPKDGGPAAG